MAADGVNTGPSAPNKQKKNSSGPGTTSAPSTADHPNTSTDTLGTPHSDDDTAGPTQFDVRSENEHQSRATPRHSRQRSEDSISSGHSDNTIIPSNQCNQSHVLPEDDRGSSPSHSRKSLKATLTRTWLLNKGVFLVMSAQFFGASMNVMTRVLELDGPHGKGMHPFEILFARMAATVLCSSLYMWYKKVPNPFGVPSVRPLLVLRGVSGFVGVFGLYQSLMYLPLSEATVLTFLAPILTCYACSLFMANETFSRKQQLAAIASLFGVFLIARPMSIFSSEPSSPPEDAIPRNETLAFNITIKDVSTDADPFSPTPEQRLLAIAIALMGVIGATAAYTSIRKIGQRAHPLVSVNYFSVFTTIISLIAVLAIPSVSFRLPSNITEAALLIGLGCAGFFLQFLLTAGLSYVPPASCGGSNSHGSRATSMVYTQMIFALFYDKVVWNSTPSGLSWAGSGIILGSALYVALSRDSGAKKTVKGGKDEEENGLFSDSAAGDTEYESDRGSRREWTAQDERIADEEEARALLDPTHDDGEWTAGSREEETPAPGFWQRLFRKRGKEST